MHYTPKTTQELIASDAAASGGAASVTRCRSETTASLHSGRWNSTLTRPTSPCVKYIPRVTSAWPPKSCHGSLKCLGLQPPDKLRYRTSASLRRSRRSRSFDACMAKHRADCLQIQALCSAIQDPASNNAFGAEALPRQLRR